MEFKAISDFLRLVPSLIFICNEFFFLLGDSRSLAGFQGVPVQLRPHTEQQNDSASNRKERSFPEKRFRSTKTLSKDQQG